MKIGPCLFPRSFPVSVLGDQALYMDTAADEVGSGRRLFTGG